MFTSLKVDKAVAIGLAASGLLALAGAVVAYPAHAAGSPITLAEVANHATARDCWSAVDGTVYDLTSWISQHPGGSSAILGMCGRDATAAFARQHGGQGRPAAELAGMEVGPLAGASTSPSPSPSSSATALPSASAAPAATGGYTMRDVRQHRRASSCWAVVSGTVYDLTTWVSEQNTGRRGAGRLCGHDVTRLLGRPLPGGASLATVIAGHEVGPLVANAAGRPGSARPAGHDDDDSSEGQRGPGHGAGHGSDSDDDD